MTTKLKHNSDIRVKSASVAMPKVRITKPTKTSAVQARRRLKPLPVKEKKSKIISIQQPRQSRSRLKQRVTKPAVARNKTHNLLPLRTTRVMPTTKSRMGKNRVSVRSSRSGFHQPDRSQVNKIKNIGQGKVLIIVGNGPSHKEAPLDELKKYAEIDFMSVNRPDDRLWPTDHWIFCDNSQLRRHKNLWHTYNGNIINSSAVRETKNNCVKIKSLHGKGFSHNLLTGMHIGRSSVYAAIQVGLWMGYDRIYIFGCDMAAVNGRVYPWGSNPDVADKARVKRFKYEAEHYNWFAKNGGAKAREKITFCTTYNPWKFIKFFENLNHMAAIDVISKRHAKETIPQDS